MIQMDKFLELYSECTEHSVSEQNLNDAVSKLGMDSLSMLLLLNAVETAYGIHIPLKDLKVSALTTLGELYEILNSFTAPGACTNMQKRD